MRAQAAEDDLGFIDDRARQVGIETRAAAADARNVHDPATASTDEVVMPGQGDLVPGDPRTGLGDQEHAGVGHRAEPVVERGPRDRSPTVPEGRRDLVGRPVTPE
jgi:hypothetical protein